MTFNNCSSLLARWDGFDLGRLVNLVGLVNQREIHQEFQAQNDLTMKILIVNELLAVKILGSKSWQVGLNHLVEDSTASYWKSHSLSLLHSLNLFLYTQATVPRTAQESDSFEASIRSTIRHSRP